MRHRVTNISKLLPRYSQRYLYTNPILLFPRIAPNFVSQRSSSFPPLTENSESKLSPHNSDLHYSLNNEALHQELNQESLETIDEYLHPLYNYFAETPLFEENDIRFINLRPEGSSSSTSWVDWVVIVTLKPDREKSLRAATNAVADVMQTQISWPEGLKPPTISIEGLRSTEPVWGMVDAGIVAVHVMTPKARQEYNVEAAARDSLRNEGDLFHPS